MSIAPANMGHSLLLLVRGLVLLAFLIVMPLLAVPAVGKWYDAWLLGEALADAPFAQRVDTSDRHQASPATMAATADSPQPETSGEQFEAIPRRLQELGAEHLRLESLAGSELQYRFECTMPLPANGTYHRQFEATALDPVSAMERVLAQVEAWRVARDNPPEASTAVLRR